MMKEFVLIVEFLLKSSGNLKEAEIILRRAIKINTNFSLAYANLGNV